MAGGVGWIYPCGPCGAGWWLSPVDPRRHEGKWRRLSQVPPKVLTVRHLLACIAKLGVPPLFPRLWGFLGASCGQWAGWQAAGDLLLCPLLQVCWASCRWSARMEARGPCLSSAATQVSWVSTGPSLVCPMPPPCSAPGHQEVGYHLPPLQEVFGPAWARAEGLRC